MIYTVWAMEIGTDVLLVPELKAVSGGNAP